MPTEAKNFLQSVGLAATSFVALATVSFTAATSLEAKEIEEFSLSAAFVVSAGSALATFFSALRLGALDLLGLVGLGDVHLGDGLGLDDALPGLNGGARLLRIGLRGIVMAGVRQRR